MPGERVSAFASFLMIQLPTGDVSPLHTVRKSWISSLCKQTVWHKQKGNIGHIHVRGFIVRYMNLFEWKEIGIVTSSHDSFCLSMSQIKKIEHKRIPTQQKSPVESQAPGLSVSPFQSQK